MVLLFVVFGGGGGRVSYVWAAVCGWDRGEGWSWSLLSRLDSVLIGEGESEARRGLGIGSSRIGRLEAVFVLRGGAAAVGAVVLGEAAAGN